MARLDVRRGRKTGKLFLEVQADRLNFLKTRFVVPLSPGDDFSDLLGVLYPIVMVREEPMVMVTHLAVAVLASELGEVVACLTDEDHRIITAIDTLIGAA